VYSLEYVGCDVMGRGDATKTDKLFLVYPSEWTVELEQIRQETGGLAIQDAVRNIVAQFLSARKEGGKAVDETV